MYSASGVWMEDDSKELRFRTFISTHWHHEYWGVVNWNDDKEMISDDALDDIGDYYVLMTEMSRLRYLSTMASASQV